MKQSTLRTVIITHFQLMSSIYGSFPEMNVDLDHSKAATTAAAATATATATATAASNRTAEPLPVLPRTFTKVVDEAAGAIFNIKLTAIEFFTCFMGPRHESRVLYVEEVW
jgi:hypothetical protein